MRKLALALAWLASLILVAGWVSSSALKNQLAAFGIELDKTQAMLAFNHMDRYRELEHDLSRGCYAEALEKARISKDQELFLLSSFLKEHPDGEFAKVVSDKEPALVGQLRDFKSSYYNGNSWAWPKCAK